jgi:hypothetical protein
MSNHLENPHLAGTPAGANGPSAYPSDLIPWRPAPCPYPVGNPAVANPGFVYEPQFVVCILPGFDHFLCLRLLQAPSGSTYTANTMPLYPWRAHSDVLKQVIRNLTLQVDSEVMEVRKEKCGSKRSRVIIVLETPDEI